MKATMSGPAVDERAHEARMTYRRLLGQRLYVHLWVRAGVAVALVVASLFAHHVLDVAAVDPRLLGVLAAFVAAYDVVAWLLYRFGRHGEGARGYERLLFTAYAAAVLDFLALSCALWLVGGCRSPFVAFYLLHVIVSILLFPRRGALALAGLAYALLVLLVALEWTGIAPPRLPQGAVAGTAPLESLFALTVLVVYGVLLGMTCFLLRGITRSLRRGERRLQMANEELVRLSEQRRGFLELAMHNLKAPVGAVRMFLENLLAGLGGPLTEKQREWLTRGRKRLVDLSAYMAEMQTLASLESEIALSTFTRVDLGEVAEGLVEEYRDVAQEHGVELRTALGRPVPAVVGHPRLLREAIVNYLTNALRHTPRGGRVEVRLRYAEPFVRLEVADDGEGIAPELRGRLFGDLARPVERGGERGEGRSGLGLAIVKRVVLAHGGRYGAESRPGEGSVFHLELPPLVE